MRDQGSRVTTAHVAACKGAEDRWLARRLARDIESMGYAKVTLKTDREPAIIALSEAVQKEYGRDMVFEHPPAHDPQSNGAAEKAVGDVIGQARSIKKGLEQHLSGRLLISSAIMQWVPEHAAWLISNFRVGRDGRTAVQRITGRRNQVQLCEFGEQVWVKPMRAQGRREGRSATLDSRWRKATWLGVHDRTNEHLVAIEDGGPALRVRTVRRRPAADKWDRDAVLAIAATPRQPETRPRIGRGGAQAEVARAAAARTQAEDYEALRKPGGEAVPRPHVMPDEPAARRDFRITRKLLEDLGRTDGCEGCRDAFRPSGRRELEVKQRQKVAHVVLRPAGRHSRMRRPRLPGLKKVENRPARGRTRKTSSREEWDGGESRRKAEKMSPMREACADGLSRIRRTSRHQRTATMTSRMELTLNRGGFAKGSMPSWTAIVDGSC